MERLVDNCIYPNEILGDETFDMVCRVAAKYDASLAMFGLRVPEFSCNEENHALDLQWGVKLEGGMMTIKSVIGYPEIDPVCVVAGRLEMDLEGHFNPSFVHAEALNKHPSDTLWRRLDCGMPMCRSDNVVHTSLVDALDEPLGAIWIGLYSPPDRRNTEVPRLEHGHVRLPYIFAALKIEPASRTQCGFQGARQTFVSEVQLPSAIYRILCAAPSWMLKWLCRSWFERQVPSFAQFATSPELRARLRSSSRAPLYEHLRRRLDDKLRRSSSASCTL